MGLDFSQLYSLLGLEPGCSLEELKHAYRKRVAELHPDKHSLQSSNEEDNAQLAALIPLYRMAIHFHELHGRLPGSTATDAPTQRPGPATLRPPVAPVVSRTRHTANGSPSQTPASHWWLLLALACLVGYLVFSAFSAQDSGPATLPANTQLSPEWPVDVSPPDGQALVTIGMDTQTVLSIQGQPSRVRGGVWEYGPSWLRFKDGRLVEWHSSPLYRLRTPTHRDQAEE